MAQTRVICRVSSNHSSQILYNECDWRDTTDPVERKRRQNRLRQRAWRERKRAADHINEPTLDKFSWKGYGMLIVSDQHEKMVNSATYPLEHPACQMPAIETNHKTSNKHKLIPPLLPYMTYATLDEPPPQITFPLSADHCLITLVQYNVIRAMMFNMAILSLLDHLPRGCTSTFNVPSLGFVPAEAIPPDLRYTPLQQSTPHPYWISVIPVPRLRDNLILSAGKYDEHEFCYDLGLGLYEGFDDVERRGFLVWGQTWRGHEWEMSEGFLKKWGFLLKGCLELIESTNCWREVRGDDRLINMAGIEEG